MYEERFYRNQVLSKFKLEVSFRESDLLICTDKEIDKDLARDILIKYYGEVDGYTKRNPLFLTSLSPLEQDNTAPPIVKEMIENSRLAGIGPFSSVAGAIAQYVGTELLGFSSEIIVENGGDLFLKIKEDKSLGVYLGERLGVRNISLKLKKRDYAFGIASSSSVIGHSLNLGRADLVTVVAKNSIAADGFATALSNKIKKRQDVDEVLEEARNTPPIEGLLIAFEGNIFLQGNIELAAPNFKGTVL